MDIQTITGNQKEGYNCDSSDFQIYVHTVPSQVDVHKINTPFQNSFYPYPVSYSKPSKNETKNFSHITGSSIPSPVPIQTSSPLPSVREMLKDLLGKCEEVRENWKFQRNEFSVKFYPEISSENNLFKKEWVPLKEKPETGISNTKKFQLQTFNLDELTSVLSNKIQQLSPKKPENSEKFPENENSELQQQQKQKKKNKNIQEKKKKKKNISDTIPLITGFTEKHIPNGRFPIILEEYIEKKIPVGQFEIDFSQTPKKKDNGIGFDNSGFLETVCDIKKRKFSENDFFGMMDEEQRLWKRPKLLNNNKFQTSCANDNEKIPLFPELNSGDISSSESERDINSNINNSNPQKFGKNGIRKRVLKMSGRKSWTKMTPKLFSDVLFWERAQGRAVKRTEIESKWNVNRTTYHRWKRNYGIEDTGKSFYLEYCGVNNFK